MCTMDELNRTMENLTAEVRASRQETASNTVAVAELAAKYEVWQTVGHGEHARRLARLEEVQREDAKQINLMSGKNAGILLAVILVANVATAIVGFLIG